MAGPKKQDHGSVQGGDGLARRASDLSAEIDKLEKLPMASRAFAGVPVAIRGLRLLVDFVLASTGGAE